MDIYCNTLDAFDSLNFQIHPLTLLIGSLLFLSTRSSFKSVENIAELLLLNHRCILSMSPTKQYSN